jgi:hypothetical protein
LAIWRVPPVSEWNTIRRVFKAGPLIFDIRSPSGVRWG